MEEEIKKLKLELMTVIMGYERELIAVEKREISDFSNSCMERYYQLARELKEKE